MEILAEITELKYKPFLCKSLNVYNLEELEKALSRESSFILKLDDGNEIALSKWVSPKRTRSYPYQRVYDTFCFMGKIATIIPVIKDEGKDGDRDFLQWDTLSLMSLLNVYVIISYYSDAARNHRYKNKITNQVFDVDNIKAKVCELYKYYNLTDPLHWNLCQVDEIDGVLEKALDSYTKISEKTGVEMHSRASAMERISKIKKSKENFVKLSRSLARKAQKRESVTEQPKENLNGKKARIIIKNYLGGCYFWTCDEVEIDGDDIYLIEGKHTQSDILPSESDIKDGLLKMALYCNLENVSINGREYNPIPVLKLTCAQKFDLDLLNKRKKEFLNKLKKESRKNGFRIKINDIFFG